MSWEVCRPRPELRDLFSRELGILPLTAQVLINRGIDSLPEARVFLAGGREHLSPPQALPGIEAAVERLALAVKRSEKVLIYGDYDVDGLTAAAILGETLRRLGIEAGYCLPQRLLDGYGLHLHLLERAFTAGYRLVVTVDCGITAVAEAIWAKEHGVDLIVSDHHLPGQVLPEAVAVINPHLAGVPFNLAGAGVAFKLAQGLAARLGLQPCHGIPAGWALDLAVLGTIADAVPLLGENRLLVRLGLPLIRQAERLGIKALLEVAGLEAADLDSEKVAYVLAPRLNAAGRLGTAFPALELLTSSSPQRAWELALALEQENQTRQLLQDEIYRQAGEQIEAEGLYSRALILLASPHWHPGVLGIVAARLVEHYGRPVILLALYGDRARGSGRSVAGVDLHTALSQCRQHILSFGGHSQAVGLEINTCEIEGLRSCLEAAIEQQWPGRETHPRLRADAEVLLNQLTPELALELEGLAPFGEGNPRPLFLYRGARVKSWRQVGKKANHLKLHLAAEGRQLPAIGFRMTREEGLREGSLVDLVFRPALDDYNGDSRLELILEEVQPVGEQEVAATCEDELPPAGAIIDEICRLGRQGPVLAAFNSSRLACASGALLQRWGVKVKTIDLGPEVRSDPSLPQILLAPVEFLRENRICLERSASVMATPAVVEQVTALVPLQARQKVFCPRVATGDICLLDGWALLRSLLQDMKAAGRQVLIYSSHLGEARSLFKHLRMLFGDEEQLLLENPLTTGQVLLVQEQACQGRLKVLLSPRGIPAGYFPAEEVVFTFCPANWEELWGLLPAGWGGGKIYIHPRGALRTPLDLRGELAKIYRRLRYLAGRNSPIRLALHNNSLLWAALGIFAELGLIATRQVGPGLEVRMIAPPASKLRLENAWRYRQLEGELRTSFSFRQEVLGRGRN